MYSISVTGNGSEMDSKRYPSWLRDGINNIGNMIWGWLNWHDLSWHGAKWAIIYLEDRDI